MFYNTLHHLATDYTTLQRSTTIYTILKRITPTASPAPAAAAPTPSQQLNNVVAENNDAKISEATAPPSVNTINNTVASGSKKEIKNAPKLELPSVRNQEETFRRMIYYSTRVV